MIKMIKQRRELAGGREREAHTQTCDRVTDTGRQRQRGGQGDRHTDKNLERRKKREGRV